jgi:hypothetical protein
MPEEKGRVILNMLPGQGPWPYQDFESTQGREPFSKQVIGIPSSLNLGNLFHFLCGFFLINFFSICKQQLFRLNFL